MKTGIIANINHQYVILNDKRHLEFTTILNFLLPNDVIEYSENENGKLVISRLKERKTHYLFAVVTKIDDQYAYLYSYNLPKCFCPFVPKEDYKIGDTVIIMCSIKGIDIFKKISTIKDRKKDKELFLELFELNACNEIVPDYEKVNDSYYTKPFKDLRHLYTFNVDPTHSTDFDDAISIEENRIYVHIVDATFFTENEHLESLPKAFTFYLPDHIENMIKNYSSYSLNKGEDRNVITIEYILDENQNIDSYDIYPSIIKIKRRYDYSEFLEDLQNFPSLISFNEKWSQNTLNIPHIQLYISENGTLDNYVHVINTDLAYKIIETLMIVTNLTVSKHIKNLPQRFHNKIKTYNEKVDLTDNEIINSILTVKKYKNAIYSNTEKGHSGLGLITYTHFTSPIRRYFDVIIHKMLAGYDLVNKEEILHYINEKERLIDSYTKCYTQLKLLDYFDTHKMNSYDAYVINKTDKGIVVFITEFLFETFIFTKLDLSVGSKVKVKINQVLWDTLSVKSTLL